MINEIIELYPFVGAGKLRFDRAVGDIIKSLGEPERIIEGKYYPYLCYYYYKSSLRVDVDPDSMMPKAFEISSPLVVTYDGVRFIGMPYSRVKLWFMSRDDNLEFDGAGLDSYKLGIGIYAESAEKVPDDPVESCMVYARDYYSKIKELG